MLINEAPGDLQNGVEYQENECTIQLMRSKEHKTMHLVSHAKPIYTGDLQTPVLFIGLVPVGSVCCLAHLVQTQCKRFTVPNYRINCPF